MSEPVTQDLRYVLEVEALDLGADVKAVGLDLMEMETREPALGRSAAEIWAAALKALAGAESWTFDFFAHLDRVREYCRLHNIVFEEKSEGHLLAIPAPEPLPELIERFAGETFGARAGALVTGDDATLEGEVASRGVDGYHNGYRNYLFCAVCDFENGFLTLLTEKLWASEVLRRLKPAVERLGVEVSRPH